MHKSQKWSVLSGIMALSMVLAACQPQTIVQTQVVEVTKEVVQQVVQTQVVVQKETQVVVQEVQKEAFTTPHPILGDLKVRQALAYCTDKLSLIKSVYPLLTEDQQKGLILNSFIMPSSWAYAGDDKLTIYNFDADKGKALLDEAGWKLPKPDATFRQNANGDELSLHFTTTTAAFRQTWAAVYEKQMAKCGIRIVRLHAPSTWWFGDTTGLARRDFELGAYAWVGQADPGGQTLYACDQVPTPKNNWQGQNYMGWCNEKADKGIKLANNSLIEAERKAGYLDTQVEFTKDVPSIPLFNRSSTYAMAPDLAGLVPPVADDYYAYDAHVWEKKGSDTVVLGWTQEPASLFILVEDAMVANLAFSFIDGQTSTSHNFSYQNRLYKGGLPTIESGAAKNEDIAVKAGDKVVNAAGDVAEIKAGDKVKDATGAEVAFADGTKMKQLTVNYTMMDGVKFSDGQPLTKADFELAYKINCDKDSGATSFITCDRIAKYTASDTGYSITYVPGYQPPIYYVAPWKNEWYPAHRVIADGTYKGKTLADVPAKDWATLPEVATNAIGVGPYVLTKWDKGQQMVFTANPNYVLGAPKSKQIIVKFVTPENAEAQLLGGEVDLLDATTLTGVSETLKKASDAGKVKIVINPSATWEHIDINMFVK